jgi:uncharacterized protein (TIGR03435 family)
MIRTILCSILFVSVGVAQISIGRSEPPQFEVAAIHASDPKESAAPSGCLTTPGLMRCANVTLKRCIVGAYGVGQDRVLGGPDWINTDRFQITGRADQPIGDKALMAMLQTLLAERFKLVLHRETGRGETMVLVLEVGANLPKLQSAGDVNPSWKNMHDHLEATKITMSEFAEILSRNLNIPVMDRTGLVGEFSLTLHWNPDNADALERDEAAAVLRSEVAGAIARQLGLALKERKMPVEVLVIDHAERPSEN